MTYGEIRYRVKSEAPGVPLALIDGYLLDRYTSILDRLKWQRLDRSTPITTVAGQPVYALPADAKILRAPIIPALDFVLEKLSAAELDETAPGREASGPPRIYSPTLDSTTDPPTLQIELYPVPDDVYNLTVPYTAEAPAIGATDATLLPWLRPSALIAGATADALEHLKDFNGADRKEAKYERYLDDMLRTEAYNRGPLPVKMADWMTRHNLIRALRSSSRTGPRLP